jgi:hypothetical protein
MKYIFTHYPRKSKEERLKETIKRQQRQIIDLKKQIKQNERLEVFGLKEICSLFGWEEQKGRKFLKVAMQQKYATQIGKNIIITNKNLNEYLNMLKGKKLEI